MKSVDGEASASTCGADESSVSTSQKDTKLSNSVTVARYLEFGKVCDQKQIAAFIHERFEERYITPLRNIPLDARNGFCTMAISCLLIETLESFWQGWPDTGPNNREAKCGRVFSSFFSRCKEADSELGQFSDCWQDFYTGVRCGILHQAETTNGWRIRRDGALYDSATKTINATKFHAELAGCLDHYCHTLESEDWDSDVWKHLKCKMTTIIKNCNRQER